MSFDYQANNYARMNCERGKICILFCFPHYSRPNVEREEKTNEIEVNSREIRTGRGRLDPRSAPANNSATVQPVERRVRS
jgi:hypothetical protein